MWLIWLIAAGVFFVIEIATIGFLTFWLGIASLLAMVVSFFTANIVIQTSVFVIFSILLILATKPLVNKFAKNDDVSTNVYSLIGKKAIVTEEIDWHTGKGQIKVDGEIWSAKTKEEIDIPKDSEVIIEEIDGVKAFVRSVNSSVSASSSNV